MGILVLVRQYPPPSPAATVNDCIRQVSGLMSDHAIRQMPSRIMFDTVACYLPRTQLPLRGQRWNNLVASE